ncbi:nucleoside triphosphate pyrophosphohydrolase [Anaerovorax odorimutans]|uniref:nucleoside triphosphate pyrophosphohydrolase n=1 Tax=Anaerovorax odorimutans TaxID=109327 RepID=UPI00042A572E|nr:nucleoside triphosphate pyrophosphohydrolase [Anaerovorax odorimutans]
MDKNYESFYIEANTAEGALKRLMSIIKVLRQKCPWDKVQTHESLKQCLIEESYEVIDAIDKGDFDNLEEELGDVFLQVVFHADLGDEEKKFDFKSIANRECEKMLRRHPHVFLKENAETIDKVLEKWENVKSKETGASTYTESMDKIPRSLPALIRSYKIQKKAAHVGFDWESVEDAFSKIKEESKEVLEVYKGNDKSKIKEEIGDLLFAVVNVARFLDVNPEDALNFTSQKFIERFRFIEDSGQAEGKALTDMTLEEMDRLWEKAKEVCKNKKL